jgi:hypothetical protein
MDRRKDRWIEGWMDGWMILLKILQCAYGGGTYTYQRISIIILVIFSKAEKSQFVYNMGIIKLLYINPMEFYLAIIRMKH